MGLPQTSACSEGLGDCADVRPRGALEGAGFQSQAVERHPGTRPYPPHIAAWETLNIFSINGDYLVDFKRALEREGIAEWEELELPWQYSLFDAEQPVLYTVQPKTDFSFAAYPPSGLRRWPTRRLSQ